MGEATAAQPPRVPASWDDLSMTDRAEADPSLFAALIGRAIAVTAQTNPPLAKLMRSSVEEYNAQIAKVNGR